MGKRMSAQRICVFENSCMKRKSEVYYSSKEWVILFIAKKCFAKIQYSPLCDKKEIEQIARDFVMKESLNGSATNANDLLV